MTQLAKALRDAEKIDGEAKYGMISQILKFALHAREACLPRATTDVRLLLRRDAVFNKWDQAQLVLPTS